jgi:hypothetical protein
MKLERVRIKGFRCFEQETALPLSNFTASCNLKHYAHKNSRSIFFTEQHRYRYVTRFNSLHRKSGRWGSWAGRHLSQLPGTTGDITMGRTANDDRSDSMNPNNDAYDDSMDNHSNQLNPNNDAYQGHDGAVDED